MPTSTFAAMGVRKVDFTEHKSYSSYFVLIPTELYDYRQVRVPRYLGKSVRELSVGTKRVPVSCLCSILCGMRSGFVVFVPKISLIGAREPGLAECFFPFDVLFDAANREFGVISERT